MDFIKRIKEKIFGPRPVKWNLEKGHVVEEAFVLDGTRYYMIKDAFNTYAERGLYALSVYEEWNKRCTVEHLQAYTQGIKNIYNSKNIELSEIIKLNEQMIERLNFVLPTSDIIWRLCSVVFFDETESPYRYDPEYAKVKIERWRKSGKIYDFFLSLRISQLIPLPELSEEDLSLYLKVVNQVSQSQLDNLLSKLTSNQRKAGYYSELNYQKSLVSTGIN